MQAISNNLFNDIINFEIGSENDALTFVDRLSRENNWSLRFAQQCVEEYKKFIYLAMISDTPVTPSDEVDQVWHLHLTYTESYWVDLCQGVLKRPFHHGPTKGGDNESKKYHSQYQTTLDKYTDTFKQNPPSDIWPSREQRFRNADKFVRLNTKKYLLLKRKSIFSLGGITALSLLLVACVSEDSNTSGIIVFLFLLLVLVCFYIIYKFFNSKKHNKKGNGCGSAGGGRDDGGSGCGGCGGCGG